MSSRLSEAPLRQAGAVGRLLPRISPRAAYAVIAIVLLAIGALALRYHASAHAEATEQVLGRRLALAQFAAATFAERLERSTDLAASLASRVRFAELVSAGQWDAAIAILRGVPEEFPQVERLFLADTGGTLMAETPALGGVKGRSFAQRDWYRGVSRGWKTYVSTVYRRTAHPQLNVVAVAAPVLERASGRVTGILVLQVSLEALFGWAQGIDLPPGATLLAVDAAGQAAYATGTPLQGPIADRASHPAVRRLQEQRSGVEISAAQDGIASRIDAFVPAKHGWGIVLEQPAGEAFAARDTQLRLVWLAYGLMALFLATATWLGLRLAGERREELARARGTLARHGERLRILHEIDRAIVAQQPAEAISAAVIRPLRELLDVPRAIVNRFDLEAGEVEWIAAAGRRRVHVGPGVRYSIRLMGDLAALRRGEPQRIDVDALPPGPEREALLASDVRTYMVMPMVAGGELIGALSFGASEHRFPAEKLNIAQEVATQLAIAISQARLHERVLRHAQELEQRVEARTAELQAANKELESFSYSVSHDLRAPLRAINGFARILEEDYGPRLDAEGVRLLGVVRDNAGRMGQLIDDLLEFSRLGRKPLALQAVDMGALAREVAASLRPGAPVEVAPLPQATADPALLRQVWVNLIDNALKYAGKRPEPRVEVGGRAEPAEAVYWVRDNGVGFDMRYADKLFGVFQRLHAAADFPGTGVGLAIVQRVVARHGGRVWAEGKPGEGACFFFALPRPQ